MTVEDAFAANVIRLTKEKFYGNYTFFANSADVNKTRIYDYASGKCVASLVNLWKMAKACDCSMDEFTKGATE